MSIEEDIEYMEDKAASSVALWRPVNRVILTVLKRHRSRNQMAARLRGFAGPVRKGEPVSLSNFRTAADQIERGDPVKVI